MGFIGRSTESGAGSYIATGTPTTLLTASLAADKVLVIRKFVLVNLTTSPVTVQIYKVPNGGVISGDDWKHFKDYSMAALETWDVRECAEMHLENGDSLRVMAGTASAVRCSTLDYLEESQSAGCCADASRALRPARGNG